jgi:hypothetical protein
MQGRQDRARQGKTRQDKTRQGRTGQDKNTRQQQKAKAEQELGGGMTTEEE